MHDWPNVDETYVMSLEEPFAGGNHEYNPFADEDFHGRFKIGSGQAANDECPRQLVEQPNEDGIGVGELELDSRICEEFANRNAGATFTADVKRRVAEWKWANDAPIGLFARLGHGLD